MSSNLLRKYLDVLNEGYVGESMDQASVIGYNSGMGQSLEDAARDPKAKRTVQVIKLEMGSNGAPMLRFKDRDGSTYAAEWNPQYGWVADFD